MSIVVCMTGAAVVMHAKARMTVLNNREKSVTADLTSTVLVNT